jgi:hypothetical protein
MFLLSALPLRYGAGLDDEGSESDGRAIWRILTGAPPGGLAREERRRRRPDRAVRPIFLVALTPIMIFAVVFLPQVALWLVVILGLAALIQRPRLG